MLTQLSLENGVSFLYQKEVILDVPELGKLNVDIGFGGNFFAIIDSSQLPIPLSLENRKNTPDSNGGYTCQCVFGDAQLDISPCGTGTCTRLAQQYSRGNIGLNETFIQNSLWGSSFYATAMKEIKVGGLTAVIPKVSCQDVRIIGYNHLVVEQDDLHKTGLKSFCY
ncbi:MAG: proline racemase family protein [Lachnospiraceae bacterium]